MPRTVKEVDRKIAKLTFLMTKKDFMTITGLADGMGISTGRLVRISLERYCKWLLKKTPEEMSEYYLDLKKTD